MMPPPVWFWLRVDEGLTLLRALRLPGTPRLKGPEFELFDWVQTLWPLREGWDQERDATRLAQAFGVAAVRVQCWPTPTQVLACMPPWAAVEAARADERLPVPTLETAP